MSETELNALLLQFIAGDIREMLCFDTEEEYRVAATLGHVRGSLWKEKDEWFYYVGGESSYA